MGERMNIAEVIKAQHEKREPVELIEEAVDLGIEEGRAVLIDRLRAEKNQMAAQIDALKWVIELLINNRE